MSSESKYENSGGKVLHTSSLKFLKSREKKVSIHCLNPYYNTNIISLFLKIYIYIDCREGEGERDRNIIMMGKNQISYLLHALPEIKPKTQAYAPTGN